jgi:hypothetical protein
MLGAYRVGQIAAVMVWMLAVPAGTFAQQTNGGIAGIARDTSGAVLPGVTVEASSSVLIERVRTSTTDGDGRFNIVDLPPGKYVVTFSLPGFSTVKNEGVELTSGFTATVNADMRVGSLEETITVSGSSPIVDTQNVRKQIVASREILDALPTSTKSIYTLVALAPGFSGVNDVGGRYFAEAGSYHGKRGTKAYFDGMGIENSAGNSSYQINAAVVEEMVLQTSGISAEVNADGPVMNIVPKEGGNTFKTILSGNYSGKGMESTNLTQGLKDRGLKTANKTIKLFDEAASVGGPIMQNKLWFFGAVRTWGLARQFAGVYWNKTQNVLLSPPGADLEVVQLTPWVDRPLDVHSGRWEWYDTYLGRLTWQAGSKHKFNLLSDNQHACNCGSTVATTLQEVGGGYRFEPNRFIQGTYNSPITSKLLLEAGVGASISQWNAFWQPGVQAKTVAITDVGNGYSYGATGTYRGHADYTNRYMVRGAMTYVTGSHTFKTGFQREHLKTDNYFLANGNVQYTFRSGVPQSILQRTTPYLELDRTDDLGIFAQDQWKLNKFTFNYGLRFDYVNGYVPEQDIRALPTRSSSIVSPAFRPSTRGSARALTPPSMASRTGWISTRAWASLTTCSATAALRSKPRSVAMSPRPTSTSPCCLTRSPRTSTPPPDPGPTRTPITILIAIWATCRRTASAARSITPTSARPIQTRSAGPTTCGVAGACATSTGSTAPRFSTS